MDELSKAIGDLTLHTDSSSIADSIAVVIRSLDCEGETRENYIKAILDSNLTVSLKTLLTSKSCYCESVARLVAEIAKTDAARLQCTAVGLIGPLLDVMSSGTAVEAIQACRALGNICFDNDNARCEVCEERGVERLLDLLVSQVNCEPPAPSLLRKVACGFLFNLINTRESLIEKALSVGVVNILNEYILRFSKDEDVILMVLLAMGSLADSEMGRAKVAECEMTKTIVGLLAIDGISTEVQETVLELFASLAESDVIKVQLADHQQFNTLLNVMKKSYDSDDDRILIKNLIADLLVFLLTGDESMRLLYDDGKGQILAEALEWMKSSSEHLQNSGALAIGNIARSDNHCVELVRTGITADLLDLLSRHPVDNGSCVIHHAVFSALRNLAIPAANKPLIVEQNFLEKILPYTETQMSTVLFKLLATLRMIVDGQEVIAISLGTNDEFMLKLSGWCKVDDHEGVRGEANRLVASIVKNSRCRNVMECVVRCGTLEYLVKMSSAEHVVMQNEAIIALTLLASVMTDAVFSQLAELNLVSQLKIVITDNKAIAGLLMNTLTLVKCLATSDILRKQLLDCGFVDVIANLNCHDNADLKSLAQSITI